TGEAVPEWRTWALLQQFEQIDEREQLATPERSRPVRRKVQRGTPVPAATPEAPARMIQADLPPFAAVRGGDVLYIEYETGETEYYDLAADPDAMENLAETVDVAVLETMKVVLAALAGCAGETCRTADASGS
ncbi:MAG: hypothetical protein ACR2J8_00880, partial [Thermomicrobiales bacterium]